MRCTEDAVRRPFWTPNLVRAYIVRRWTCLLAAHWLRLVWVEHSPEAGMVCMRMDSCAHACTQRSYLHQKFGTLLAPMTLA